MIKGNKAHSLLREDAGAGTTDVSSPDAIKKFLNAFMYAFDGLMFFFRKERNALFHLTAAFSIACLGICFHISETEWLAVILCIGLVISFEMMNSALEHLCNFIEPSYHSSIKKIKDISAAAVLWISVISIIVAVIIFLPKIFKL